MKKFGLLFLIVFAVLVIVGRCGNAYQKKQIELPADWEYRSFILKHDKVDEIKDGSIRIETHIDLETKPYKVLPDGTKQFKQRVWYEWRSRIVGMYDYQEGLSDVILEVKPDSKKATLVGIE